MNWGTWRKTTWRGGHTQNVVDISEAAYTAQGIEFDGATDLTRATALGGVSPGKEGILSFWFRFNGGDGSFQMLAEADDGNGPQILRMTTNDMRIQMRSAAGVVAVEQFTASTFLAGGSWKHLLMSWNSATATSQIYINDVSDAGALTTNNEIINYDETNWCIGNRDSGGIFFDGDMADFYWNMSTSLDLTNSANRRLFISAGGAPVYLGATGEIPTGVSPAIFLSGAVATWATNKNVTAGGFTENGTLVAAATDPP